MVRGDQPAGQGQSCGPEKDQMRAGTPVEAADGFIGTVGHPVVDPQTNLLTGFILHKGLVTVVDVFVPIDLVVDATPALVKLFVTRDAVERLVDPHDTPTM